jgi:hypothetical protein
LSQRVTADHSRRPTALLGIIELAGVIALTSCTAYTHLATALPPSPSSASNRPDAAHRALSGGPEPPASQPYHVPPDAAVANKSPPSAAAPPTVAAQATAAPPASAADSVVGQTLNDVRRTLGEPADQYASGGTRTWIYRQAGCSLELTSYYDVSSGDYVVVSQKTSPAGAADGCASRKGG